MLKRLTLIIYLIGIIAPLYVRAAGEGVVINSFRISTENGVNDEYVELANTGPETVDISGWKLAKKSASASANPVYLRTLIPEGTLMASGGKLVIAHPDCSCTADIFYATSGSSIPNGIAADNTIIISNKEKTVMDKVGFGTAADVETAGIPASPGVGDIYARKNNGQDTDNNKNDFYLKYSPPKEEDSDEEEKEEVDEEDAYPEATAGAKIRVSEFVINPEGSDADGEWIEIVNLGKDANIAGYAIADRLGSPKKYKFPKGTVIKSGDYLAFYSGKTPISLNNDGDAVEIQSPEGTIISYSKESGKGPEGMSFAWSGSEWSWTKRPTPGRANIIEKPTEAELAGTKKKSEKGEVLALVNESQLPGPEEVSKTAVAKKNDQILGYGLIILAIIGGISYTLYINKDKLREFYFNRVRKRDFFTGSKIWQKLKRRRGISSHR